MPIELVVFDIAGTTVADEGNINKVFRNAFSAAGLDEVAPEDVDKVMGYRKKDAIKIIVKQYKPGFESDEDFIESIHEDFTQQMVKFYEENEKIEALPFAEKTFKQLHDQKVKVALNTGFTRAITTPILQRLGWDKAEFIDEVICSDEVPEGRPAAFMIDKLREKLHISSPEQVAKIGDTQVDIEEGQNAQCGVTIGITTGAYTKEELLKCKPDYVINSLDQLPSLIL